MGTIVSFHAHPDDESIATSGLLARASDGGHRVVLVFATRGELGTPVDGVLDEDEQLALRRTAECYESAAVIGAHRVEFLGFTDSGMEGEATNDAPWSFRQADVDHAARRLAVILEEEKADVITTYDDHGGYGHPDHVQVHRVGKRAAELAGVPVVAQSTMNRDHINRSRQAAVDLNVDLGDELPSELPEGFGSAESIITHSVDAQPVIQRKRSSMLAHGSQIGADHFMAAMPLEAFEYVFGTEWFIVEDLLDNPPAVFGELFKAL